VSFCYFQNIKKKKLSSRVHRLLHSVILAATKGAEVTKIWVDRLLRADFF